MSIHLSACRHSVCYRYWNLYYLSRARPDIRAPASGLHILFPTFEKSLAGHIIFHWCLIYLTFRSKLTVSRFVLDVCKSKPRTLNFTLYFTKELVADCSHIAQCSQRTWPKRHCRLLLCYYQESMQNRRNGLKASRSGIQTP